MSKYLYNIKFIEDCLKCDNTFKIITHKNYPLKSFVHRDKIMFTLYKKDMDRLMIYRNELLKRGHL